MMNCETGFVAYLGVWSVPVGDGALVDLAGRVESGRRAIAVPSRKATSGMAQGRA